MCSILDSPFVHEPHDFIVPGLLTTGDLPDIAAAIAPRPLRVAGLVDGTNRRAESLREWQSTSTAYVPSPENLLVEIDAGLPSMMVDWLISKMTSPRR